MGRVPVYLYDDVPWLPYENTNISFSSFGFIGRMRYLNRLFFRLLSMKNKKFQEMVDQVREVRKFYTYEGVLQQIDYFLKDPMGPNGGYLRCNRVPEEDH